MGGAVKGGRSDGRGVGSPRSGCILLNHCTASASSLQRRDEREGGERRQMKGVGWDRDSMAGRAGGGGGGRGQCGKGLKNGREDE